MFVSDDEPLAWPTLTLSADQGPDCSCAQIRLLSASHYRLSLISELDVHNHGIHNDTMNAAVEAGLGGFCFASAVCLNLQFLPWSNGTYGNQVREAAKNIKERAGSDHHTFSFFYESIGLEQGYNSRTLGDAEVREQIWQAFTDSEFCRAPG